MQDITSNDSLPYWFVFVDGVLLEADGTPASDGSLEWRHHAVCEGSAYLEHATVAVGADGEFQAQVQVETANGCFEFIGAVPAGDTMRQVLAADQLPLRQKPPYDTVPLPLHLP